MPAPLQPEELIHIDRVSLMEDPASTSPVVMLHDRAGKRILPIWIGDPEARAIDMALNKITPARPLTHHLLLSVIKEMGGKLVRVVIDSVTNHTYYAALFIQMNGVSAKIDSRPSDAIALALEGNVPLFINKSVMDAAGQKEPRAYTPPQEKKQMSREDVDRVGKMLEEARLREEQASNQ